MRLLAGIPTERVDAARAGAALWTTGLWYYRAARAVQSPTITGSLPGELSALSAPHRSQAVRSIVRLPDDVGLLSLREIVPVMSELSLTQRLNLLSLEALGAAVHLHADVAVARENDGRLLREAVSAAGLQYSTV